MLVMADTREQVAALNGAIRDRLLAAGYVEDRGGVITGAGERLGVGDRVMTRRNDRDLQVANRDTWTVIGIDFDGTLTLTAAPRRTGSRVRSVPAAYVAEHVELAYATTVHGAQGETTHTGHLALGEHTTAAAAYVAMTRGRDDNVAHLVADDLDDARGQWVETFGRDRADLGPEHAAQRAAEDLDRYAPHRPFEAALADLRAAWATQRELEHALARSEMRHAFMTDYGDEAPDLVADFQARVDEVREQLAAATDQVRARLHEPAIRSLPPGRLEQEHADWLQHQQHAEQALQAGWEKAEPSPRAAGAQRPRHPRAHPPEAAASADDPPSPQIYPRSPRSRGETRGKATAGRLIARRPR